MWELILTVTLIGCFVLFIGVVLGMRIEAYRQDRAYTKMSKSLPSFLKEQAD